MTCTGHLHIASRLSIQELTDKTVGQVETRWHNLFAPALFFQRCHSVLQGHLEPWLGAGSWPLFRIVNMNK
jgi:hypothetical protein